MNNRQSKLKGQNQFHYHDKPTDKGCYKRLKKRKTRNELKKYLQKERKKYIDK
ncbi:hypothetical protein TwortDSMZ_107 [Staphylococcus phage Twort]|uniref:ORF245 n=2 Tax=Staphylococcus phage Twort (strain DSM 17442 / HER 48) TaxID=2908167 RepID=Q4Z9E7_BPTWO|nr:ORF245 [Staphylococcus phage Twort]AAX92475.1 ORF245 [Staphylococcus phage Twort]QIW89106.1 hypothetical protein TwortDSMZ_107 [Staphylococcus phage Twort]